jgi:hypothetical protein
VTSHINVGHALCFDGDGSNLMSPPLKRMVSRNQDLYEVSLPK